MTDFNLIYNSNNPSTTEEINSGDIKQNTSEIDSNTDQLENLVNDLKNVLGETQSTPTTNTINWRINQLEQYVNIIKDDLKNIKDIEGIKKITEPILISSTPSVNVSNTPTVMIASTPAVNIKIVDENGGSYGIKQIDNKLRVSAMPYLYDIAEDNVANHTKLTKLGYNPDVDNIEETLWGAGGAYVFPSTAIQMEILSSNVNDTSSGTGARTIHIHYLDNNYNEQLEIITLNGTNPVNTVATNILRINSFHVNTAGSGNVAAGNITLRTSGGGATYAYILAGFNNSQQSIHTVPHGKTLYLVGWQVSSGSSTGGTFVTFRLMSNVDNNEQLNTEKIFHVKDIISIQDTSQSIIFQIPFKIPATCDVIIDVIGDANNSNATCSGRFHGWQE